MQQLTLLVAFLFFFLSVVEEVKDFDFEDFDDPLEDFLLDFLSAVLLLLLVFLLDVDVDDFFLDLFLLDELWDLDFEDFEGFLFSSLSLSTSDSESDLCGDGDGDGLVLDFFSLMGESWKSKTCGVSKQ